MSWISWVSKRFAFGRLGGGSGRLVFLFSVVLIGVGVAALITIMSVMNGLQQGYIRSILEIGSYHVKWTPSAAVPAQEIYSAAADLLTDPQVAAAAAFREGQTMLSGQRSQPSGALIRGVSSDLYERDAGLADRMDIVKGRFDMRGIVLGENLAYTLGVSAGDFVTALNLGTASISPPEVPLEVTGLFRCGYGEYESSMAFVSLETFDALFGPGLPEIGIKLPRLEADRSAMETLQIAPEGTFSSWRENNRAFFGALRTEKTMMLLLLTLIFVVVAVNIDQSLRRMVTERIEDLSILKAMGASPGGIRKLFLRQGLMIGGIGAFGGSLTGVLVGANVDKIISAAVSAAAAFRRLFVSAAGEVQLRPAGSFFKSSQVMVQDVLVIFILALSLSVLAAVRASRQAARQKPAEVLRSE